MKLDASDSGIGYIVFSFCNILWLMNLKYTVVTSKATSGTPRSVQIWSKGRLYFGGTQINKEKSLSARISYISCDCDTTPTNNVTERFILLLIVSEDFDNDPLVLPTHEQGIMNVEIHYRANSPGRQEQRKERNQDNMYPQWPTDFLQGPHLLFFITSLIKSW